MTPDRIRRPAWSAVALLGTALLAAGATLAGLGPSPASASPASASPGTTAPPVSRDLASVYCVTASDCWAVGSKDATGSEQDQVLHRTGTRWVEVAVPDPAGKRGVHFSQLSGVQCPGTDSCWAVGSYVHNGSALLNQVLHWNGSKWRVTTVPNPAGTTGDASNALQAVTCATPGNCWAVGLDGTDTGDVESEFTQALHWNGKTWTHVSTPNPDTLGDEVTNRLNSVQCASVTDCWAGGTALGTGPRRGSQLNLMLHWNGKKWATATVPNPGKTGAVLFNAIFGLSCVAPGDCWAAGTQDIGGAQDSPVDLNELLHWNGSKWRETTVPNPAGPGPLALNQLLSVTCDNAADCWATGDFETGDGQRTLLQALHWNGKTWSSVAVPEPAGPHSGNLSLRSAWCTAPGSCWAVGLSQVAGTDLNVILHWTGRRWLLDSTGP